MSSSTASWPFSSTALSSPGPTASYCPKTQTIRIPNSEILMAFLIAALYAIFGEAQQGFIPNRQPSLLDFLADSLGSLLAQAGIAVMRR